MERGFESQGHWLAPEDIGQGLGALLGPSSLHATRITSKALRPVLYQKLCVPNVLPSLMLHAVLLGALCVQNETPHFVLEPE